MRKWYAVGLLLSGVSLWGCGDEKRGPGVGPETSWQIGIAEGETGTAEDAHGPIGGRDEDDPDDDIDIKVDCREDSAGLQIELEDPGEDDDDKAPRARSVLKITNIDLEENKCTVQVSEYERSGAMLLFIDQCKADDDRGSCTIEAERDSNGYALEGTIVCDNMRIGVGADKYTLRRARDLDEPVTLQIANCR